MKILAVEFSSPERSVAIVQSGSGVSPLSPERNVAIQQSGSPEESGPLVLGRAAETNSHRALGLVEEALQHAHCEREEIEAIVIGLGPGSYTGIRGAIALAQGWSLGRNVALIGISSVECLAARAVEEKLSGPINIIIDAQRNEFYLARYEISPGACRPLDPLRLASFAEIESLATRGEPLLGPGVSKFFPGARNLYPDAAHLARLASETREHTPPEKLEPIYLREPAFKKAPPPRPTP